MQEVWKDIPDYNGYQVSNLGRIRTYNKITYTEKHGKRHWKNRILKYKGKSYSPGYRVDLWKAGKPKTLLVARLVAFTFYEKDINDTTLTVNHIDGNRLNNNLKNLEIISLADNIRHAFNTGLMPCKQIKLTNKHNKETKICRSMTQASELMQYSKGYISAQLTKGIYENKNFKWEVI